MAFEEMRALPAAGASTGEVFEYVYARYFTRVRRVFFGWTDDWGTSEDLAQELFASLWREMADGTTKLREPDKLMGFLRKRAGWVVSRSHFGAPAVRQARREKSLDALMDTDAEHEPLPASASVAGPETQVPARIDLGRTLAMLPPTQRRAVALHYLENMPCPVVAEETGVAVRTVENRIHAAMKVLRQAEGLPERTPVDARREAVAAKAEAIAAYRASVAAGSPLTLTALGARVGRSKRWAFELVRESGEHRPQANAETGVREQLREELTVGTWPPGARITSAVLAERFGAGVNPGRVLRSLHADGLLEKKPTQDANGVGYFVPGETHLAPVIPLRPRTKAPVMPMPYTLGRAA